MERVEPVLCFGTRLGRIQESLRGLSGSSRDVLAAAWGGGLKNSDRACPLNSLVGSSWGRRGRAWAAVGPSAGSFGVSWGCFGRQGLEKMHLGIDPNKMSQN